MGRRGYHVQLQRVSGARAGLGTETSWWWPRWEDLRATENACGLSPGGRGLPGPVLPRIQRYYRAESSGALHDCTTSLAAGAKKGGQVVRGGWARPWRRVGQPANPEPDGATRATRAQTGGRFRREPGRMLHLRWRAARRSGGGGPRRARSGGWQAGLLRLYGVHGTSLIVVTSKPSLRAESLRRGFQFVTRPEGYTTTLSFIPSLGACTKSCFVPR